MGCNCTTTEQINELYRRYGEKRAARKPKKIKAFLRKAALVICLIPVVPILVLYVFYKAFCDDDNKISVRNFFKLKNTNIETYVG